jgi:hypothetical protein
VKNFLLFLKKRVKTLIGWYKVHDH